MSNSDKLDSSTIEYRALNISHRLSQIGKLVYDEQLQRRTLEEQFHAVSLRNSDFAQLLGKYALNPKYSPELADFKTTISSYLEDQFDKHNHRRLVYFNDKDYSNGRWQCISLVQFIPVEDFDGEFRMMIYQRSGDCEKMIDDWRFFCELAYTFNQIFHRQVAVINIMYGSLHKTYIKNEDAGS